MAGTAAAAEALGGVRPTLPQEQVDAERRRIWGFLRTQGPFPVQVKLRIRDIMWELGYVKNETKLRRTLGRLRA